MQKKPLPLSPKTTKIDELLKENQIRSPIPTTNKTLTGTKRPISNLKTDPSGDLAGYQPNDKYQLKDSIQLTRVNLTIKSPQGSLPKLARPLLPHERISPVNGRETYYNLSKEIDRKVVELLRTPRVSNKKIIKKPSQSDTDSKSKEKTQKIFSVKLTKKESPRAKENKREEINLPNELKERIRVVDRSLLVKNPEGRAGPHGYKGYSEYLHQQNLWGARYHDQATYNYNLLMKKVSPSALDYSKIF